MATVAHAITEIDVVSLKEPIETWPAGTKGTVVYDFGPDKMVEISNHRGEALGLPIVHESKLTLVEKYA
jgi:Domain of unknown function (DUF4926)